MNTHVNFETAKLLKEKGCDIVTIIEADRFHGVDIISPTIADVIMWLYEKHGIWVAVTQELGATITFCYQIMGECISATYKAYFTSPTEAYQEAIKYCLTELI